jgi:hypothetical protein
MEATKKRICIAQQYLVGAGHIVVHEVLDKDEVEDWLMKNAKLIKEEHGDGF